MDYARSNASVQRGRRIEAQEKEKELFGITKPRGNEHDKPS